MTGKDQYSHEAIERMRHTGFRSFDVIIDAAYVDAQVGFLYISTDIAEDLLSGPDIIMDVLEGLFAYRSLVIEMFLQISRRHHREILFSCEQVQSSESVIHLRLSYYLVHELFYTKISQERVSRVE